MKLSTEPIPKWMKTAIMAVSALWLLPSLPIALGLMCLTPLVMLTGDQSAFSFGVFSFAVIAITCGILVTLLQANSSLQGKPSKPLRLPHAWWIAGIFGLCVIVGVLFQQSRATAGFASPLLIAAAAMPPLWAVAWFMQSPTEGLSWRRGSVASVSGATISVVIALAFHLVLSLFLWVFIFALNSAAMRGFEKVLTDLANGRVAQAVTNPSFVLAFVQGAIIAPLAEEIAKPLVTLPLIGRLARREAFLVAAMAGAGFAAMENVIYASAGLSIWAGILVVRSLGGAIHPLGAGLVGLAWRDILNGEHNAWRDGLARFGIAAGMHALWNGGSLLVFTLAGAQFFGTPAPAINLLGLSVAGTTLALLIVLGLAALWIGRAVAQSARLPGVLEGEPLEVQFMLSDRAIAIWALVCLVAIVPVGIAALRLVWR